MTESQEAPELKSMPATRVIAMEHRGAYDEIGAVFGRLSDWAKQKGVEIAGKGRTVFLDPPSEIIPESARYLVCLPVSGEVEGDGEVEVRDLPAQKVYAYVHKGPYREIPAKYTELLAWVSSRQYEVSGRPFEVYLKHPAHDGRGEPDAFVTEICLPVEA